VDLTPGLVTEAREAFGRQEWMAAFEAFRAARECADLSADDCYALADAAWWVGEIETALGAWENAHQLYVRAGQRRRAAMAAMFVAAHSMERGDAAVASGWMKRMHRLLRDEPEGAEHGYPLYYDIFELMSVGDLEGAVSTARRMHELGDRFDDSTLVAVALVGEGRAVLKQGRVGDGMGLLDEAMVAAMSGDLHPVWAGAIYCHLMDACHQLGDVRRAAEWTQVAERWCERLPDAGLYRGICRVHRAQVLQLQGAWDHAEREATRACAEMVQLHLGTVAAGHYEIGEIRRLRGDVVGAEEAFRRAHELGHDAQPGLALVRLAYGEIGAAMTSIRAALAARAGDRLGRAELCAAQVEIALAADEVGSARTASEELDAIATAYASSGLTAAAGQARGALLLAAGDASGAVTTLRSACRLWQELDAKHRAAMTRITLAEAFRALGDEDAAQLELDAACAVFERLGARLDVKRVAELKGRSELPGGLTEREAEVLRLVATGISNRDIAAALFISERTVHRHVSNIFAKLGVPSRTAAAAFAFEHHLVREVTG
jgi:ATP/maltotriose-dependent transcriptional regulator MalT